MGPYHPLSPGVNKLFSASYIPTSVLPMFSTLDQLSSTSTGWLKNGPNPPNSMEPPFLPPQKKTGDVDVIFFLKIANFKKNT